MWCLYKGDKLTTPIRYSNGKTQEDIVYEILEKLDDNDIVFFKGSVGSGKSAIALHLVKYFGTGHIVVPTKILEHQYKHDYKEKKFSIPGLDIYMLMGKSNYKCMLLKTSCGDKDCPCSVPIKKGESRINIASECIYWAPPFNRELARKVRDIMKEKHGIECSLHDYKAINGSYSHVVPPVPCLYYREFKAYTDTNPHATIFNLAKWEIETMIGRKPVVPIEIIDEGDQFLDELTYKVSFSNNFFTSLEKKGLVPKENISYIKEEFNRLIEKIPSYDGLVDYRIEDFLFTFIDVMAGISTDGSVCEKCNKIEVMLRHINTTWCRINKKRMTIYIPRPDITLWEIKKRCGKLVLMSGTFQSVEVLKRHYGIDNPAIVEGETRFPGTLIINKTNQELRVNSSSWNNMLFKTKYYRLLNSMIKRAKKPCLVQVHAYKYVPPNTEVNKQNEHVWWSTTTNRGVDLSDDKCRSIVVLKFPYPDLNDPVLKTMKKLLGDKFWSYYRDIASRTLIQQIGRGLRHKNDWVEVWSPDKQVIDFLSKSWNGNIKINNMG